MEKTKYFHFKERPKDKNILCTNDMIKKQLYFY